MSRLCCTISDGLKNQLEIMSKDLGLHQSQLIIMAMQSLVANYEEKVLLTFLEKRIMVMQNRY